MSDGIKVYLAGRIREERERFGVVSCDIWESDPHLEDYLPLPAPRPFGDGFIYTGPFTVSNDHGGGHYGAHMLSRDYIVSPVPEGEWGRRPLGFGTRSHGSGFEPTMFDGCYSRRMLEVYENAHTGIKTCDHFFAWIDDQECYGTLVEIGIAAALGKPVTIGAPGSMKRMAEGDLWFAVKAASDYIIAATAEEAVNAFLRCRAQGREYMDPLDFAQCISAGGY